MISGYPTRVDDDTPSTFQTMVVGALQLFLTRDVEIDEGIRLSNPRGKPCIEIKKCGATIPFPQDRTVLIPGRRINYAFAIAESLWILAGKGDFNWIKFYNKALGNYLDGKGIDGKEEEFWGAYGVRLRHMPIIDEHLPGTVYGDQLNAVIIKLKKDPDTRQAVVNLWDSRYDNFTGKKDYPCNVMLMFDTTDNYYLNMTVIRRSNDVVLGVPYNAFQFTLIQEYIAQELNLQVGAQTIFINNFHIYTKEYPDIFNRLSRLFETNTEYAEQLVEFHKLAHTKGLNGTTYELPQFNILLSLFFRMENEWRFALTNPKSGISNCIGSFVAAQVREIDSFTPYRSYWNHCLKFLLAYHLYKAKFDTEANEVIYSLKSDLFLIMWAETVKRYNMKRELGENLSETLKTYLKLRTEYDDIVEQELIY